ncbi:MAG TPA: type II toxin-antitoxin system prevent-host-death family antitoxin [Anaerolineae bacterium]|nr:type II toxin-antitoxin system prevent-host-death family antitoxin [Anaerolineae bacterium]
MKIVVSVNELATETQLVIDNMRRSKAPVIIGEVDKPVAVLISLEEYERLQQQTQPAAPSEATQPSLATAPQPVTPMPPAPDAVAPPAPQLMPAEAVPAAQSSDIAQRAAATIQADRAAVPAAKAAAPRPNTPQPDSAPNAERTAALRSPRVTKQLPKPPRPLEVPRPRAQFNLAAIPGGWQTLALVVGMLALGLIGFALIVNALGG